MTTDKYPVEPPRRPLGRDVYRLPVTSVAQSLLGRALVSRIEGVVTGGVIVETEAYLAANDPASHSHRGQTVRNRSMFARPGTLYVYSIHAKWCLNAVTEPEGVGSAVLIRALEPLWGLEVMHERRGTDDPRRLTRGPAMLCQALGIDRRHDGLDLTRAGEVWIGEIERNALPSFTLRTSPRIGIRHAADLPLRFFIDGNRFVSGAASVHGRRPSERLFRTNEEAP